MELIYNQTRIPKDQWRYGLRSSAKTGCGWVAVYNTLTRMGYRVDIPELIELLEKMLPLIHGNTGTFCLAPQILLKAWGFPTKLCTKKQDFDNLVKSADGAILFYYWRSGLKVGSHFISVYYEKGSFYGINVYSNSSGPDLLGSSLSAFLEKQNHFGCLLLGVWDKDDCAIRP